MAENQLLPFANGDTANVIPFADWSGLSVRLTGFQSGIASSQQFNRILGQGGAAGYVIGQFVADFTTDNATINATALYDSFKKAIAAFVPGNIADGSIGTTKIANGAITNAKLANDAVTSAKLADNSVGTEHIQSNAVTADEIAAGAVGNSELANGSVTFPKIASAAIATQQQAEAGTATNVFMTPQRVKQAIDAAFESDLPMASATQLGGVKITGEDGITINGSGEIAVDFSEMPTDKFEDMLKSIRVPIWLTKSTNFYVNGLTGSDTLDEGRGLSSSKPFKTISACSRYICDNYNLATYVAYINIEPMTYTERVQLANFTSSGGYIIFVSSDDTEKVTIQNSPTSAATLVVGTSPYWFRRIKFVQNITNSNIFETNTVYSSAITQSYTNSRFIDCDFELNIDQSVTSDLIQVRVFWAATFSSPIFQGNTTIRYTCPEKYKGNGNALIANGNARISVYGGDSQEYMYISGDYLVVVAANSGEIFFNSNGPIYDVILSVPQNETCTGKRYDAASGGAINTDNNGPEYIPGTIAGTVDSATYSWYK